MVRDHHSTGRLDEAAAQSKLIDMTADPTNYARYFATLRNSSRIQTRGGRILLVRRGALNAMDQRIGRYANRAPERRGFWAFPHPHYDECCVADVRKSTAGD